MEQNKWPVHVTVCVLDSRMHRAGGGGGLTGGGLGFKPFVCRLSLLYKSLSFSSFSHRWQVEDFLFSFSHRCRVEDFFVFILCLSIKGTVYELALTLMWTTRKSYWYEAEIFSHALLCPKKSEFPHKFLSRL